MHKVIIGGSVYEARDGERLSQLLMNNGLAVEHPCGGRGICGKCKVTVDGNEELSCKYIIHSDIKVELCEASDISSESGAEESGVITENLAFALDIGTTTLALALISLDEKRIIKVVTASNPQRIFGADVMTRISYCKQNGTNELKSKLIDEINRMVLSFGIGNVPTLYVSGNATMLHLFFGIDCSSIGVAPYTPVFLEGKSADASELGIIGVKTVITLPSIASFVGADIVAGLGCVGIPEDGKYNLLIDLGTNAEIVLYSNKSGVATAAAAGPCFEGAGITCGMSATRGAIYSFGINEGETVYKTIEDATPTGICGTGLIDIITELVREGTVDESGYMDEDYDVSSGVFLACADVRQYQLAKSAVCSAILTLMKRERIGYGDIAAMYISGGFSAKINIRNAADSGLLPKELSEKAVAINNSSLLGTVKFACDREDLSFFTDKIEYVDLSKDPYFSELFVENMMFL